MTQERMKLKTLALELKVDPKALLPVAQGFDTQIKSAQGSVSLEAAERIRRHYAEQKEAAAQTQPRVIVRRRHRETPEADKASQEKPVPAAAPSEPSVEKKSPAAPAPVEMKADTPVAEISPAPVPVPAPEKKARIAAPAKARVISLPDQEKAAPAEPASVPAPVEEKPAAQTAPEEKPAKAERAVRLAQPDASASPEGSSAPTLPAHDQKERPDASAPETREAGKPQPPEAKAASASGGPKVRIISRPASTPPAGRQPGSRPAPGGNRYGRDDSRGPRSGQPGSRPGGRPAPGGYRQQPAAMPVPDSRDGQSKKKRLKGRRTVDFQQGDFGRNEEDDITHMNRSRGRRKTSRPAAAAPQNTQPLKAAKRKVRVTEVISVADMAKQMGLKANELIKVLFNLGVMATINQSLDIDTATLVAAEFGYEVEKTGFSEEEYLQPQEADAPESLKPRPPVVTIMGHVDHGKTSLLDAIRKSHVTSGEAGGITQHIGAYHVKTKRGDIVFLDTPGHEAFTAMRARGAQITDLVILVVAADDGVMEQTREAISHSRAAGVPIVVAVNKMDKPGADPDRVLRELAELGLQPEDWGGDTIVARISAKTRQGLDDLLEMVALQSEIMELKANPDKPARGHIVEARLDKGRGPVATVLIQEGTLRHGDSFVCGQFSGRVRGLLNDQGKKVREAGPSIPVEVQGFEGVPDAGEEFSVVADEKVARRIADARAAKQRERELASESRVTLETFLARHASDQETANLNLVVKTDVQGSLEAITDAVNKMGTDKVKVSVVHGGTGAISESDILLASASQAIIIGFNVRPAARVKAIAEHEGVDIRFYDIIYKLKEDIESAMKGLLAPVQREVYLGQAEVRNTFNLPKVGTIAGCYVADGKIQRNAGVRLLRDGVVIYTGRISSLKRFKDDAREVVRGNECGAGLENFNDIKVGDVIEAFETVEEAAEL